MNIAAILLASMGMLANQTGPTQDRIELIRGVGEIAAPQASPGVLSVSGKAFVFATGTQSKGRVPIFAAVPVERGRAVAASHERFFSEIALKNGGNGRLLGNILSWLGRKPVGSLRVGLMGYDSMAPALRAAGISVSPVTVETLQGVLGSLDVICATMPALEQSRGAQVALMRFVKSGHGLFLASAGWGWSVQHPNQNLLADHPGNQMLFPYGICFTQDTANQTYLLQTDDSTLFNTDGALEALKSKSLSVVDRTTAVFTVERALSFLPPDASGLPSQIDAGAATDPGGGIPSVDNPITPDKPFSRLKAWLDYRRILSVPVKMLKAHPSAQFFPGSVPASAARVTRSLVIDTSISDWHSTGFYAAPGELIQIQIPEEASKAGLRVRIGPHFDRLWQLDSWPRFPDISLIRSLPYEENQAASPFGGTIYIEVPPQCHLGKVSVGFKNVVPAAWYVKGQTTAAQWKQMINGTSAPWVELQGDLVILSVPLSSAKTIVDPAPLMNYWDQVLKECYAFYATPRRTRQERYCTDVEISAGYMHSGYPIMTHMDVADTMCSLPKLLSKGKSWGFYHEVGHNFQASPWTWSGTGEVTNNLFSLYASERMNRITPHTYGEAHPAMDPQKCKDRLKKYLASGAHFEDWCKDPFLALTMFAQLRQAFGWDPFTRLFAEYQEMPVTQWPADDTAKRDAFLVRFSKLVQHDLGPFFQAWGIPTSPAARGAVIGLPAWMPSDWPVK